MSNDVTIRIRGDAAGGVSAFEKTEKAAASAMSRIHQASESVRESAARLTGVIAGLGTSLVATSFINGVRQQLDLADSMGKAAEAAGVTTQSYTELAYAARQSGLENDDLGRALQRLNKSVIDAAGGDEKMRRLLVDTLQISVRDASGEIRAADDVLMELVGRLNQIQNPTLRAAAAMEVFGDKLGPKLMPFINSGKQGLADLREEARKLGLTFDDETAKGAAQLNDDLERLRAVQEGLYNQIMMQMLPGLNSLATMWLTNNRNAGTFLGTLKTIGQAIKEAAGFGDLASQGRDAKGASNRVRAIVTEIERLQAIVQRNPGAVIEQGYGAPAIRVTERIKQLRDEYDVWAKAALAASQRLKDSADAREGKPAGGQPAPDAPAPDQPQIDSGALERALANPNDAAARQAAAEARRAAAERARAINEERRRQRELYEDKVAGLRLEMAEWRNNTAEQLRLAEQIAEAARKQFGVDSSEYSRAQQEVVRIKQRAADQLRAIQDELNANDERAALAAIALEQQQADNALAMGLMTQRERLSMEEAFEARIYEIKAKALQQRLQLLEQDPDLNPVERQRLYNQIEELERQHQARKSEIDGAKKKDDFAPLQNTFQALEDSMASATTRMLLGQQTAMQALNTIWQQAGTAFVQEMVTKPLAAWLAGEAQKTAATLLGVNTRTTAEATGAEMSTGITAATALKTIGIKAYEAAASVYASISAIPVIGPFLAPAMAVGAIAAVGSFASRIFSAEGGFDIPAGVNPMVQAHAKEMILPAKYADVIRGLAANGGGGGGGSNVSISVSAIDARSVERWLRGSGGQAIVNELGLRQRSRRF